jgi:hypothetical protein
MPVQKICNKYRYGANGKLYSSKAKAVNQGVAIRLSQIKAGKKPK